MQILNFLYILLVISNFLVPLHPIFGGLSVGLLNGDHKNRALKRAWCAEIWKISTEHRNGFVSDSRFGYVCLRDCMAFPYADNRIQRRGLFMCCISIGISRTSGTRSG